jgi:hypothetical protein
MITVNLSQPKELGMKLLQILKSEPGVIDSVFDKKPAKATPAEVTPGFSNTTIFRAKNPKLQELANMWPEIALKRPLVRLSWKGRVIEIPRAVPLNKLKNDIQGSTSFRNGSN